MKVYELMAALAKAQSGAEVYCSGSLSVNELRNRTTVSEENIANNSLHSIIERLCEVEILDNCSVYLDF